MRLAVVGAGWAGLSAAVRACAAGHEVSLFDAARTAGGRARALRLDWGGGAAVEVDNGQHLVIGAYTELLELLALVNAPAAPGFARAPMQLVSTSGLRLASPDLPGLIACAGLGWRSRVALLRVLAGLRLGAEKRIAAAAGHSVERWWKDARQPPELIDTVWHPLVLSALNTAPSEACAATFLRVLRDSVAGPRGASDFLLPEASLGEVFVDPVLRWLQENGAHWYPGVAIGRIDPGPAAGDQPGGGTWTAGAFGAGIRLHRIGAGRIDAATLDAVALDADAVIVSTPPAVTARLIEHLASAAPLVAALRQYDYRPITTIYLGWREPDAPARSDAWERLPVAMMLREEPASAGFGQWFFRRPPAGKWRIGAVVISDSRAALELPADALAEAIARQVCAQLSLAAPQESKVVHEKRATFACRPDRPRVTNVIGGLPGIVLAGDYQYGDYPATLEAALRSGRAAAQCIKGAS